MARLTFDEYQLEAATTAIYPGRESTAGLTYVVLGLAGEAGEVANKVKKVLRDDNGVLNEKSRQAIAEEASDVLWYLAMLCYELEVSFDVIAEANLNKLKERQKNNTLHGSGDAR